VSLSRSFSSGLRVFVLLQDGGEDFLLQFQQLGVQLKGLGRPAVVLGIVAGTMTTLDTGQLITVPVADLDCETSKWEVQLAIALQDLRLAHAH